MEKNSPSQVNCTKVLTPIRSLKNPKLEMSSQTEITNLGILKEKKRKKIRYEEKRVAVMQGK
jgi:hypothetical protein